MPAPKKPLEPVRITTANESVETEPLFYIDDVEYAIPVEISAGIALRYLEIAAADGENAAELYLLKTVLTEEGYAALRDAPMVTFAQFQQISQIVMDRTMGALESAQGKRAAG
jgi:hypothetical protein